MRKAKILVLESDPELGRQMSYWLPKAGPVAVTLTRSTPDAFRLAQEQLPDLILADVAHAPQEALQLLRNLRAIAAFLDTPLLALVAPGPQKYQAFEAGANDVLTKPLDVLELQYRLQAHLRPRFRKLASEQEPVEAGRAERPLRLDPRKQTVTLDQAPIALTPSEFAILCYLAAHPGTPASTETLLVEALGMPPRLGNPQLVHTHVRNLRRKLEKTPSKPELLVFARRGYLLQLP